MRHSGSNWLWPVFLGAASLRSPGRLGQHPLGKIGEDYEEDEDEDESGYSEACAKLEAVCSSDGLSPRRKEARSRLDSQGAHRSRFSLEKAREFSSQHVVI